MTTDMSQDFTDDSYTLTESDASFDSSQHSRRRQRPRNAVEASIQEEDEGMTSSVFVYTLLIMGTFCVSDFTNTVHEKED